MYHNSHLTHFSSGERCGKRFSRKVIHGITSFLTFSMVSLKMSDWLTIEVQKPRILLGNKSKNVEII